MIIRKGTDRDIEEVSNLWLEMVKELAPDYMPNIEWWQEMACELVKSNTYHIIIAKNGERIIGFIDFFLYPEPATGLVHAVGQHFYVKPDYRKGMVSSRLWKRALTLAKEKDAENIELFCFENEQSMWMKKKFKPVRILVRRSMKCLTL